MEISSEEDLEQVITLSLSCYHHHVINTTLSTPRYHIFLKFSLNKYRQKSRYVITLPYTYHIIVSNYLYDYVHLTIFESPITFVGKQQHSLAWLDMSVHPYQ
ncbi:hypothetical protein QTP88_004556 [Uroleucon formosanum]